MTKIIKMTCVKSDNPAWFTVGSNYEAEPRGTDLCICGDNLVSDLNVSDRYEMSRREDGIWFLIGFQQTVLFRAVEDVVQSFKLPAIDIINALDYRIKNIRESIDHLTGKQPEEAESLKRLVDELIAAGEARSAIKRSNTYVVSEEVKG
ncbi:hypothetical protein [Atlantibacter hermannii]|uniref:hypothetical protein n=1 Tax=Atlantibacter hermannii TaxID=565 RepID=UPI00289729C4|nr:hypothetical protein [Atlantibacter hermannii]